MSAVVDKDLCTGCGDCVDACPPECIELVEGKAQVDADSCIDCGACEPSCPVDAISLD
ncbi:MAG: 4Fe-4S dicluster domain-containing protein [Gammaproteobacteria bacterium]|nr:MAG: 4Fe-4S dicluster domain-containing protein [Gammaproteobacteria bacterium]